MQSEFDGIVAQNVQQVLLLTARVAAKSATSTAAEIPSLSRTTSGSTQCPIASS